MKDGELKEMYDLHKVGRLQYSNFIPVSQILYGRTSSLYTSLTHDVSIANHFKETSIKAIEMTVL